MAKNIIAIFLITILYSCSSNDSVDRKTTTDSIPAISVDTPSNAITPPHTADTFLIPTEHFLAMATFLDSCNFIADTNRAKKVGFYNRWTKDKPVFIVKDVPFYNVRTNPAITFIEHSFANSSIDSSIKNTLTSHLKNLNKVKNISGYYFTDKVSSFKDLTTDGFIEEWEFENSKDAKQSAQAIEYIHWKIYVNCIYHMFQKDNYVYILFSRSDWDAKKLEPIYKKIIKKRSA